MLTAQQLQYAFQIIMMLAYGFIKLSIIAFYRRIFVTHKWGTFDILSIVLGVVTLLWTISFFLIDILACGTHITANWGPLDQQLEYCPDGYTSEYGFAISDVIIDFLILVMPIPSVGP